MHYAYAQHIRKFAAGCGIITVDLEHNGVVFQTYNRTLRFFGRNYDNDPEFIAHIWADDLRAAVEGGFQIGLRAQPDERKIIVTLDNVGRTETTIKTLNHKNHIYRLDPEPVLNKNAPWASIPAKAAAGAIPRFLRALHPKHWVYVRAEKNYLYFLQKNDNIELKLTVDSNTYGAEPFWFHARVSELLYIFSFPQYGGNVEIGQSNESNLLTIQYAVENIMTFSCQLETIQLNKRRF